MKWLIGLLAAATGILHLLYGLGLFGGPALNWLMVLNGAGYLVLLFLFWTATGSRRSTIRWILLAYTLITLVGYFLIAGSAAWQNTFGLVIKGIELLLAILLLLYRGRDEIPVVATTAAPAASRSSAAVTNTAYQAAAGMGAITTAGPVGAAAVADQIATEVDATVDTPHVGDRAMSNVEVDLTGPAVDMNAWSEPTTPNLDIGMGTGIGTARLDTVQPDYVVGEVVTDSDIVEEAAEEPDTWLDRAGDRVGDAVDSAGDTAGGAVAATGAALGAAGAWIGDKLDDAGDAAADVVDATGDTMSDAGDWVGDRMDDAGDAAADVVDATGDAMSDAGDWVGDRVDDAGDAAADVVDATGDTMSDAGGWVGDRVDDAGDAAADVVDATGETMDDAGMAMSAAAAGAAGAVAGDFDTDERTAPAEPTSAQLRSELEEYLRSFGSGSEFRKGVEYIESVGPAFGEKLRSAGVISVLDLIIEGATRAGRKSLAERTGLAASQILTWVNHIDLFRIKGVAQEYADLLEQSGVDTVVELAQRNPNNLFKRMIDINEQKQLVRRTPHLSDVQSWVEQAKSLQRLIHY